MSKLSRYTYIDVLRVISSVMVVAIHVATHYIYAFKVKSIPWTTLETAIVITLFAVPVFFMISGATIFSSTREESYGEFIKRRLSKIAIPLVAYSVIYYLFYVFVKGEYELGAFEFIRLFFNKSITGHFWYLYALIPLYFFYPALRKLVQTLSRKQLLILILSFFTIDSLIPQLNNILALFCDFKIGLYSFGRMGVYINYTLLGYYIHTYVNLKTKKQAVFTALTGIGCIAAMSLLTYISSEKTLSEKWINTHHAFVMILSACVMIFVKYLFQNYQPNQKIQSALSLFGALSFSAYLIHMLVLRTIQVFWPRSFVEELTTPQAAVFLLAAFIGGLVISYLWAFAVSKIPVIKKIL